MVLASGREHSIGLSRPGSLLAGREERARIRRENDRIQWKGRSKVNAESGTNKANRTSFLKSRVSFMTKGKQISVLSIVCWEEQGDEGDKCPGTSQSRGQSRKVLTLPPPADTPKLRHTGATVSESNWRLADRYSTIKSKGKDQSEMHGRGRGVV